MIQIKPFKAVYYNQDKVKDIAQVVCPPYDVISKDEQIKYHNRDPHNFIHVLLARDKAKDDNAENKYTRAQRTYQDWLAGEIIKEDEKPCIYFYRQDYTILGERYSRLGFISLMKLEDQKEAKIFPHERTHDEAKQDRFRLWSAIKSNLSPIFVCFSDRDKKVENIFQKYISHAEPFVDVIDDEKVRHLLWRLDDPGRIKEISDMLKHQDLFIADGHHRYEVAQQYRQFRVKSKGKSNGSAPFNFVMTYFTNMESRDLQVFPMHRIIKKVNGNFDFLEEYFRIDKIKTKDELVIPLARAGKNEIAIGLYTREGVRLLRLKNKLLIDKHIQEGSPEFKQLDATILKNFIFDRLGIQSEDITYTKDMQLCFDMVDNGEADASFLMNPVKLQQIRAIALNGERMPPKTTYFFPKVLSGLTVYKME